MDLTELNDNQKELIFSQLLAEKTQKTAIELKALQGQVQELTNFVKIHVATQNQNIAKIEDYQHQQAEKNNYASKKLNSDYISQTQLGEVHNPRIGSQYMGKLLKLVGIANKNYSKTTPNMDLMKGKNPICISQINNGFQHYYWHHERAWKLIKNRLLKDGILQDFESCITTNDIHDFIKIYYEDDRDQAL